MSNKIEAFREPIEKGLVRILLRISSITCLYENDAPDFVDVREDTPYLQISTEQDIPGLTKAFSKNYRLEMKEFFTEEEKVIWNLEEEGIWFDVKMETVKEIWLADFKFFITSERPRYLKYYLKDVEHKVQWLQTDVEKGEIRSLSEFKKKFVPPPVSQKEVFTGSEVLKCTDMLSRAISKIDMRTGKAMVKFNTQKGHLEPLIIGMGEKLGYEITRIEKDTIFLESEKGNSVSHTIALK